MKNFTQDKAQTNRITFYRAPALLTILGCLLAICSASYAADDDYLRSLEAESNNSSDSVSSGPGDNYLDALSAEAASSAKVSTGAPHGEDYNKNLKKMETLLQSKKPSTFKFYKKLSKKNQALIFEHYTADKSDPDNRLSRLKKDVMDIYFNK